MSDMEEKFLQVNKARWDELVDIHAESDFYDVQGFLGGMNRLRDYEMADIGDVTGKRLLHLQCHFGLDTLCWARLGAIATGADFSEKAIERARALAQEANLDATFVLSDVDTLPDHLDGKFDIVYTSRGVINWLPDITRWGQVIEHFLEPGGFVYITEGHPVLQVFDET